MKKRFLMISYASVVKAIFVHQFVTHMASKNAQKPLKKLGCSNQLRTSLVRAGSKLSLKKRVLKVRECHCGSKSFPTKLAALRTRCSRRLKRFSFFGETMKVSCLTVSPTASCSWQLSNFSKALLHCYKAFVASWRCWPPN